MEQVRVRVPATSANIGPGFDSLGCAFSLYNTFTVTRAEKTEILGCPPEYAGEDNLALVAFRAACRYANVDPCVVKIEIRSDVPVSRGLGSSATLLVGGAVAANLLCDLGLTREELLTVVNELEGHPDNVAPAIYGGFTASLQEAGRPIAVPCALHPSLRFCAFIPNFETATRAARTVLPASYSRADAVFNVTHVSVLLAALAKGDTVALSAALDDRLHQPYRKALVHEYDAVRAAALAAGAHGFFLSGSGSTCMAIYTDPAFPDAVRPRVAALTRGWQVLPLAPDAEGACAI